MMLSIGRAAADEGGALTSRMVIAMRWLAMSAEPVPLIWTGSPGPAATDIETAKLNDVAEDVSFTAWATRSTFTGVLESLGDAWGRVRMYTEPTRPAQASRIAIARTGTRATAYAHRPADGRRRSLGRVG